MQKDISKLLPTRLVNLTPIQKRLYRDNHRFIVNPAGRRARKTLIGSRKTLVRAMKTPGRYFHGAPTHKQAKQIFWDRVKKDTRLFRGANDKSDTDLFVRLYNGSEIHVIGLDKPERIEGQPWHGCHITEFGNLKGADAWNSNIRPVLSDTKGWAILDGVPEGRNFYYDLAVRACGGSLPKSGRGLGSYADDGGEWAYFHWFSSDVLDAEEIAAVKEELDERTFRQEYEGSFESYEGLAYKDFGIHNLDSSLKEDSEVISIGMDFNVDPMTATIGHIRGDSYDQFDEIWLNNSNTFEMRDEIKRRYITDKKREPSDIIIYPDSTGKHESSNAKQTDLQILTDAGFIVDAHSSNPLQRDRINNVNSFIKDRGDNTRYKVNPKTCPKTVNDLNKRESLPDGRLDKKQEEQTQIGHISDALGYLISYKFPIIKGEIKGLKI